MSNKTAEAVNSSGHLARPRVVPAALGGQQPINVRRTPGALVILMERGCVPKHRVNDTPGGLNRVLAREERGIAVDGVAQESLIRPHPVRRLVVGDQLDALPHHEFPRLLGLGTQRDHYLGAEAEAIIVGESRVEFVQHRARRALEPDQHLGRGDR